MSTNYPASLDSYSTKNASDTIAEGHINDPQDAIEAIEEKVGTGVAATVAQSASSNTALLGYGASLTGYQVISLANSTLVTGTLTAERGGTGATNTNTAGGVAVLNASTLLPTALGGTGVNNSNTANGVVILDANAHAQTTIMTTTITNYGLATASGSAIALGDYKVCIGTTALLSANNGTWVVTNLPFTATTTYVVTATGIDTSGSTMTPKIERDSSSQFTLTNLSGNATTYMWQAVGS